MAKIITAELEEPCVLYYTTINKQKLLLDEKADWPKVISHTYNERGTIIFNSPVICVGKIVPTDTFQVAFQNNELLLSITLPHSVRIIGCGAFYKCSLLEEITIPSSVHSIGSSAFSGCTSLVNLNLPDGIKEIKWDTFGGCTNLQSIILPSSVIEIGTWAFRRCTSLRNITLPNSVAKVSANAFIECKSLSKFYGKFASADNSCLIIDGKLQSFVKNQDISTYTIPSYITTIGCWAFEGCCQLKEIIIPDSVTTIDSHSFDSCVSISKFIIPESVTKIGEEAFKDCTGEIILNSKIVETSWCCDALKGSKFNKIKIGDNVNAISDNAFMHCSILKCIQLPKGLTKIGHRAFDNCSSLIDIVLPNELTHIGDGAFRKCTSLTTINIPNKLESLSNEIFRECSSLQRIYLPNSIIDIGERAFSDCTSLKKINIPDNVKSISRHAFSNCTSLTCVIITNLEQWCNIEFYNNESNPLCNKAALYLNSNKITELNIPLSINSIRKYSFYGCSSIVSINIHNNIKEIKEDSFSGCENVKSLSLSNSIIKIGNRAFKDCKGIEIINITDSVETIEYASFEGCSSVKIVTIGKNVKLIEPNAFSGCGKIDTLICKPQKPPIISEIEVSSYTYRVDIFDDVDTIILPSGCERLYTESLWGRIITGDLERFDEEEAEFDAREFEKFVERERMLEELEYSGSKDSYWDSPEYDSYLALGGDPEKYRKGCLDNFMDSQGF